MEETDSIPNGIKETSEHFLRTIAPVFDYVDSELMKSSNSGPTWWAISTLRDRSKSTLLSLTLLHQSNLHDCRPDCATLLRAMYDAYLQFIYIMDRDSDVRSERATMFFRFGIIDHFEYYAQLEARGYSLPIPDKELAEQIENERQLTIKWKPAFVDKRGKLRKQWYLGTLRDLAGQVGRDDEYQMLLNLLHIQTHSSPTSRHFRDIWTTNWCQILGIAILARQYVRVIEVLQLPIEESNINLLRAVSLAKGLSFTPKP